MAQSTNGSINSILHDGLCVSVDKTEMFQRLWRSERRSRVGAEQSIAVLAQH
jgi:hypothetical protein